VAPFDDTQLGLNKVTKYYYYYSPGWWQIGDQLDFIVNKKAFSELPVEYQQIVESAAWEANQRVVAEYDARNGDALAALVAGGTLLREFPVDMMRSAFAVMEGIHAELSAKSADYKRVRVLERLPLDGEEVASVHRKSGDAGRRLRQPSLSPLGVR